VEVLMILSHQESNYKAEDIHSHNDETKTLEKQQLELNEKKKLGSESKLPFFLHFSNNPLRISIFFQTLRGQTSP
jgi:hypothetical protein